MAVSFFSGSFFVTESRVRTEEFLRPALQSYGKVLLVVVDCLRLDQWAMIRPLIGELFDIETSHYFSILPTATPYARNAIFSGLFPSEIKQRYPRWWADQEWDARRNSAFQVRWGWTDAGALKIPGFESEAWQRKATRAFYFRPRFIWDTLVFTVKNPSFFRHLRNLGTELIPYYKLKNLLPGRKAALTPAEKQDTLSKCPSAPNVRYLERTEASSGHLPH